MFFSVAKLGGSVSLSIRHPSEEQGSVEQYSKFEFYSLRLFSLRLQRLRARIHGQPEKFPRFRGVLAVEP